MEGLKKRRFKIIIYSVPENKIYLFDDLHDQRFDSKIIKLVAMVPEGILNQLIRNGKFEERLTFEESLQIVAEQIYQCIQPGAKYSGKCSYCKKEFITDDPKMFCCSSECVFSWCEKNFGRPKKSK